MGFIWVKFQANGSSETVYSREDQLLIEIPLGGSSSSVSTEGFCP